MGVGCRRPAALRSTRALLALSMCAACCAGAVPRARAYSSFADYARPIEDGGGGGKLFTGTPADGYGCDVCHLGAKGAKLEVVGLPEDGYVPGERYEVTLRWPETAPHVAVMAELTDVNGMPVGVTALAPYASWGQDELCEDGMFPAADVCRLDASGGACCRDIDPTRDECSFPGERSVLWMLDCGSRMARLAWTAPSTPSGDVWFSTQMVTSNVNNDSVGDGVTALRRRIRPAGASPEVASAVGDCAVARAIPQRSRGGAWTLLLALCVVLRRRHRARKMKTGRARPRRRTS